MEKKKCACASLGARIDFNLGIFHDYAVIYKVKPLAGRLKSTRKMLAEVRDKCGVDYKLIDRVEVMERAFDEKDFFTAKEHIDKARDILKEVC